MVVLVHWVVLVLVEHVQVALLGRLGGHLDQRQRLLVLLLLPVDGLLV